MVLWLLSTRHHRIIINKIRTRHEPNHSVVNFSISISAANTFPSFLVCRPHPPSSLAPCHFRSVKCHDGVCLRRSMRTLLLRVDKVGPKVWLFISFFFLSAARSLSQMMPNFVFNLFISITRAARDDRVGPLLFAYNFYANGYVGCSQMGPSRTYSAPLINQSIEQVNPTQFLFSRCYFRLVSNHHSIDSSGADTAMAVIDYCETFPIRNISYSPSFAIVDSGI